MATAYLIVICDKDTNAVKGAEIWSSPEWEQSQRLPHPTFVAYQVNGRSYDEARHYLIKTIRHPGSRYHWLMKYLTEYRAVEMVEATEAKTETETKPENMIDPSCDWVEIVDPNHVLRAGVDWVCLSKHDDDWFAIDCSAGETIGMNQHIYHIYCKFRCLRRDHPDYQKTEALKQKPPLGVMPRKIWLENRLEELRAAISRDRGGRKAVFDQWCAEVEMIKQELSGPELQPQPQQPLRWVENTKPDKPGIWGQLNEKGIPIALMVHPGDVCAAWWEPATRCYLGPIPEILPPKKKVTERLWVNANYEDGTGVLHWQNESDGDGIPSGAGYWIRTDRTREVER